MSQLVEQLTITVPRGTRAWFKQAEKLGISPDQILRLGITQVGEFIKKHQSAKNSEKQPIHETETTPETHPLPETESGPSHP